MSKKKLPNLKDIKELKGKTVLLRTSLNVPVKDGVVTNQFRLMRALPTINYLRREGAKTIAIAHIGREPHESLKPVHDLFSGLLESSWCESVSGECIMKEVAKLDEGGVLLVENVRSDEREIANDEGFGKELSECADIYVNDAFAASHREHTSLMQLPRHLPSFFGFNFMHEYEELQKAMEPKSPSLFVLGGAKFETKLPLVDMYANQYEKVFIGGALANDMFKAKNLEIGQSLISKTDLRNTAIMNHLNILLPIDVTVTGPDGIRIIKPEEVQSEEVIVDAGPKTVEMLEDLIRKAESILWNGPLGNFEKGFDSATEGVAKSIANAKGYSIVGGGDTIASIESLCVQEQFNFLSTAGGAMLTFLEHGTLPAIDAVLSND